MHGLLVVEQLRYRFALRRGRALRRCQRALWTYCIQSTEVKHAFKKVKHDLTNRPIHRKIGERIEAQIFVAFLAYGLQVTLEAQLRTLAVGTTPRKVLAKFKTL